ncbi:hypothetical protein P170DRAFT_456817 [Aspergillus steynii IBT 23096]|uniref:Single-strand DNA deaminase toxin A-like C-terminal domain-containing protein n=1 Tax=Aspergillus steynii IBT 23096 TaxID=1392250 RepID=A0A2I2G5P8_9EURO|nr:uncharacterized protein P170DRAFT_456817 [Aspergillus steynii IBT 23096]PLB48206.1 hypothetical protein P170DRAFT_456817 [Aspergillus steynii IBT 23096]
MKVFSEADIIWWKANPYYIQCPFCESLHRHGVNWKANKLRYSHCEKMESYLCCFPLNDQGKVAYEIDKVRGRYINICVAHGGDTEYYHGNDDDANADDTVDEGDDDVNCLAIELARKATIAAQSEETYASLHGDSKELVIINPGHGIAPFEQKQIFGPISDCVNGETRAVQRCLETPLEATLFVRGKHYGRSALMEAALFGRVDNAKVLLENNADRYIKDGENRAAIDFARENHRSRRERYDRFGGDLTSSSNRRLGHVEDTFRRDIDRQEIVRLLGGENRKSKIFFGSPPTLSVSKSYSFTPSPMQDSLVLHGPIEEYPITRGGKTVARLERGGKIPWTDDVFYISESVGHILPSHPYDWGKDGRFSTCHAEKQLIAYFIDRHVFLPRDGLPDSKLEKKILRVEESHERFLSVTEIGRQDKIKALKLDLKSVKSTLNGLIASTRSRPLLKLEARLKILHQRRDKHADLISMAYAPPPASLAEAIILISSHPCQDCIVFKDKVNKRFGLSIQLFAAL